MDLGRRRNTPRTGVVAGSVWESRMKIDEVKGGVKVFNGEENNSEENGENSNAIGTVLQVYKRLRPKQSLTGVSGKRKTWKSESFAGFDKTPIQISRQRSEVSKNLNEQFRELSVSADGIEKSPIQTNKTRSEVGQDFNVPIDGIERSPLQRMKMRSVSLKGSGDFSDGNERNPNSLRKVKSVSNTDLDESSDGTERNSETRKVKSESVKALVEPVNENERNSLQLIKAKSVSGNILDESGNKVNGSGDGRNSVEQRKAKIEPNNVVDETSSKACEGSVEETDESGVGIRKVRSEETCEEFGVCEEQIITSHLGNVSKVKSPPLLEVTDDGDEEDWDEEMEENVGEEIEVEKKSLDAAADIIKEINTTKQKPNKVVIEEKKIHQINEKSVAISPIVKKQLPLDVKYHQVGVKQVSISPILKNPPPPVANNPTRIAPNEFHRTPRTHNKLQNLVDLVMWRDVSKSAFVFGIGTFIIISSSYTKDLNISLISVVSYLGLVYLAAIFLLRSFICRGDMDDTSQDYVVGEEEAVWLLKLLIPYLNEFLLKLRALFSGDPATTMKLAVLLFILARCGNSITMWKMSKLGFFGVFIVPKVCSSYSTQLTAYGTFWFRRFQDAWESCSHKKAVAFAIFTLVWNLSSVVARIWAVFMLFVAFRYYQQSLMIEEDWVEEEEEEPAAAAGVEDSRQGPRIGRQRQGRGPTLGEMKKQWKRA